MAEALEREGFYERFCFELLFHRRSYGRALCGTRYPLYLFSLFHKWETVRRRLGQVHAVRSVLPSDGRRSRDADVPGKRRGIYCLFHAFLEQGKDILHVTLSSGISGVYNSACVAREELLQKYPDRKIYIVDSLGASSGYGLLMDRLADLRDKGEDVDSVYEWALANRLRLHHWFFSTDLTFYVKGGRISKASGWFGTVLNICPLLNMDDQGRLIPRSKIRGKKAVIKEIVARMEQFADGGTNYNGKCYISNSACYEDARAVADLVEQKFPKLNGKVEINHVGTTIGSHTGPGTVALFFWGSERKE